MEDSELFLMIGKFEAKIESLEHSLDKLEKCVVSLTEAMADNKGSWRVLVSLAAVSSLLGAFAHKPIDIILGLFK
jgi:intein-encoded DNA endonuclease-like protein